MGLFMATYSKISLKSSSCIFGVFSVCGGSFLYVWMPW
jgi:hypothetical protein